MTLEFKLVFANHNGDYEQRVNKLLADGWDLFEVERGVGMGHYAYMIRKKRIEGEPPEGQQIPERLKWLRERSGKTLEDAAEALAVSPSQYRDAESGYRFVSLYELSVLAELYGTTLPDLVRGLSF